MELLTTHQYNALRIFAEEFGRTWKSELRSAWMSGQYRTKADSAALQQVRNSFGPSWLVKFRFVQEGPTVMPINEAMDKTQFLDWMRSEGLIQGLDSAETNRICQRWIKHKIRCVGGR